jgi:formylglycine-generating enzyme required for sulfatase activity
MKKLFRFFAAAALAFALAWFFYPRFGNDAEAIAAAQRERATLAFFTPKIRTYLLRTDAENRILLNDCVAADVAIDSAREKLHARTVADSDFEQLKTNYLKAGMVKLELVKKVTQRYEKFAALNPTASALAPAEDESALSDLGYSPPRLKTSLFIALAGGLLALWFTRRRKLKTATTTPAANETTNTATAPAVAPPRSSPRPPPPLRLVSRVVSLPQHVALELLPVSAGSFVKGTGERRRTVPIAQPFWLGKYEVTQEQWDAVMGSSNNPSQNKGAKHPVENITWNEAEEFCRRVNDAERAAARLPENYYYALPSEDQWEYAARAGSGDVWIPENADVKTHAVGTKPVNSWGFYDMRGNVAEMCADTAVGNLSTRSSGGIHMLHSDDKILKGPSFADTEKNDAAAIRNAITKETRRPEVGFRLALVHK